MNETLTAGGKKARSGIPAWAVAVFLLLSLGIGTAGLYFYSAQKKLRTADFAKQLGAVADLKIQQIRNWRRERLGDALAVNRNPWLFSTLELLQARPKPGTPSQGFRDWLDGFRQGYGYRNIDIFGAQGEIIFRMGPDSAEDLPASVRLRVAEALRTGQPALIDLYFSDKTGLSGMDVLAPVLGSVGTGRPVGVIVFHIDPEDFLFPLIQTWPMPSASAETLLVRLEGDDVLYLNELRHRKGTAGRLRFPLSKTGLPAAAAVRGFSGVMEGTDYRGITILAASRSIPDSPWFLVAKVDLEEILLPIRFESRILLLLCLALIATVGGATGYFIRREQVLSLRQTVDNKARAEKALRESQEKFQYIFEYSPVGKSLTLPSGEIQVNKAFQDMLGYSKEELENKKWQEISFPGDIEATQRMLDGLLQGQERSVRFQKRYVHKSGRIVWTDVQSSLRRDADGRPLYFMTAISDITERKQAEEEILSLNAELDERVRNRTARLEEANRELEAFSYSVSHDLRAPLRIIDGFSQALLEDCGDRIDEEGRSHLDRIRSNAQFMGHLIDDMLKLARVSKTEIQAENVDLSGLARQSAADIARAYPKHPLDVIIAAGLFARSDPRLLRAVLDNLFDNAWKFTAVTPRPRVEFGAESGGKGPAYFVRDNGIGFDMTYVGKLFGAFQRLHDRSEFPGTGIGLATVQRIIRRLGGRVWAEGREGLGATFFFTLNEPERRIG